MAGHLNQVRQRHHTVVVLVRWGAVFRTGLADPRDLDEAGPHDMIPIRRDHDEGMSWVSTQRKNVEVVNFNRPSSVERWLAAK